MTPSGAPFPHARKSAALEAEDRFMEAHGSGAAGSILAWAEAVDGIPRRLRSGLRTLLRPIRAGSRDPECLDYCVRPSRSA